MDATRPLADLESRRPRSTGRATPRRVSALTPTTVGTHGSTVKPAYRVRWRTGPNSWPAPTTGSSRQGVEARARTQSRAYRRPHLTANSRLARVQGGRWLSRTRPGLPARISQRHDPRRRQLGSLRASGRGGQRRLTHFAWRSADSEALRPQRRLSCSAKGVTTWSTSLARKRPRRRRSAPFPCGGAGPLDRIAELIEWPRMPSLDWMPGLPQGSSMRKGAARTWILGIANTDRKSSVGRLPSSGVAGTWLCDRTTGSTASSTSESRRPDRPRCASCSPPIPAITRKRSIAGGCAQDGAPLRVRVDRANRQVMRMYDITTGTGDFIANGVVSHNCFARPTHTYLDFDAAGTSSARSSSRSTRPSGCGRSWPSRRGRASTSRWGPIPTRISGWRAATS